MNPVSLPDLLLTGGTYLEHLREVGEKIAVLVDEAAKLSRTRPHLREHVKYLQEAATKFVVLEAEARDNLD